MNNPADLIAPWRGEMAVAELAAVYRGSGGANSWQRQPAHKIVGGCRVVLADRILDAHRWPVVLPASTPHRLVAVSQPLTMMFLDSRRYQCNEAVRLADSWRTRRLHLASAATLLEDIVSIPPRVLDERLPIVLRHFHDGDSLPVSASQVGLSASRASHLFTEQLDASVQDWRHWIRLRRAIDLMAGDSDVTQSAHDSGFADASHFWRICRNMLGLRPSVLKQIRLTNLAPAGASCL